MLCSEKKLSYVFRINHKLVYNFLNIKDKTKNKKSCLGVLGGK